MVWLEIITVRTLGMAGTMDALEFFRQICPPRLEAQSATMKVYCSAGYETDLSIHIRWNSEPAPPGKSPLGKALSGAFSHFGLINHTIWIEHADEG